MVWTIISTDETTAQVIATPGDTMALTAEGSILNSGGAGIVAAGTVNDTTVSVSGEIVVRNFGLWLTGTSDGTTAGVGSHDIQISATGTVQSLFSSQHAIIANGSGNSLVNHGSVLAVNAAVRFLGDSGGVFNFGTISSSDSYGVHFDGVSGGTSDLTNGGLIFGGNTGVWCEDNNLSAVNTGTISGTSTGIDLATTGFLLDLVNSGLITGGSTAITARNGDDIVENNGEIIGDINLNNGANSVTNSGVINGDLDLGVDADYVRNSGTIFGQVDLSLGNDTFDGRGGTVEGTVLGSTGDDTYIVDDAMLAISELAAEGTDTVKSTVGWTLGDNFENLTLIGSGNVDGYGNVESNTITGNQGNNVLNGLGSADTLYGAAGDDKVNGGNGIDLLFGGDGDDKLRGQKGADVLKADAGDDRLYGGEGNDNLFGGDDNDILKGGMGRDKLYGGDDADVFLFTKAAHSKNDATADKIQDFELGLDTIDLSGVAAGTLTFIAGAAFSGTQGEVQVTGATNSTVLVDVDGDGTADMKISVIGVVGLVEGDFIL
ncbi:MAG: calcium-binding protein [Rhodobacteraceae bacterium]|nr:calcium-binding protein [Paracoccaceae bacterium]